MNFWTPTGHPWGEGLEDKDMPWYALYDYVEVFTWNEHTNEFEFKWRDDFEEFNLNRWHKAEGGFENNSSEFHRDNVYTSHGKLVLKMEPLDAHKKEHDLHRAAHSFHAGEFVHERRRDSEHPVHDDDRHEELVHGNPPKHGSHEDGIPMANSKKVKKAKHRKVKHHKVKHHYAEDEQPEIVEDTHHYDIDDYGHDL